MGRIMALDVGEVTLGVAISDPLGLTAQPTTTIRRRNLKADFAAITDLVSRHEVDLLVVGLPLKLSGEEGPAAESVRSFAGKLTVAAGIPVVAWDERLTTVQAERSLLEGDVSRKKRREVINQIAAAIILQSYLDSHRCAEA
jgi:putative Holliday junction resolvase